MSAKKHRCRPTLQSLETRRCMAASLGLEQVTESPADSPVIVAEVDSLPSTVAFENVAAGDVNDDASVDIITGAGFGGGPHVRVFDGGQAFAGFQGGIRVATGDVNGDGVSDVVTSAGPGGGPHVRIFNATTPGQNADTQDSVGQKVNQFEPTQVDAVFETL